MRVLSLKQPWPELILLKRKRIELRSWNTHFRGEFYLHSSKVPDRTAMKRFEFEQLPCGYIVGKVNLVDVKRYNSAEAFKADGELHLGTSYVGSEFGLILEDAKRIDPIPAKGRLGF